MSNPESAETQGQSFISHLLELRDRLLRMILGILALFMCLFPFANDIYHFVAAPLLAILPPGTQMIATQVASPFLTPFKLSMVAAVFLAMPWILYQFWSFVAPGLYQHEKRLALPLMASSVILFYIGMAFAYFIVFPLIFGFMVSVTPEGVAMMTDISSYLDFVLTLFFAFGVAFEVPIATVLLVVSGITTPESLIEKRPYIIVAAFVIGIGKEANIRTMGAVQFHQFGYWLSHQALPFPGLVLGLVIVKLIFLAVAIFVIGVVETGSKQRGTQRKAAEHTE